MAIAIREITQQNMRPARESGEAAIEHGQKRPDHPGEVLLRDFLRPRGITQVEAARHLQISTTRLNEIIRGSEECLRTLRGASAIGCKRVPRCGWTYRALGTCGRPEAR